MTNRSDVTAHTQERRLSELIIDLLPMREAVTIDDLYEGLARSVMNTLKVDACLVSCLDEDRNVLRDVAASVVPPAELNTLAQEYVLDDFPATKAAIEALETVEVSTSDPSASPEERAFLAEQGYSRLLILGFMIEDEVKGTVEAYRIEDRPFRADDPEHVRLLVEFATNSYARIRTATKLEEHYTKTIEALTSALEARDPYTQAHTGRIRDLATAIALALRVPRHVRDAVHFGALLHDVGKIGIADSILQKPGPLNEAEWDIMRRHPEIGVRMLRGIDFLAPALDVVMYHHERWDGSGYPSGLRGDAIPLAARIVAVCDAFDAMTTDRPYRKALSIDQALDELAGVAGTQLDPRCALLLVEVVRSVGLEDLHERFVRYAT
ncbi:MAG: HD-GYP domain-containing protein [Actinobacteria bacterium]|nr:HD-GYP domain-containing protein [Actinomycetota bacterium]